MTADEIKVLDMDGVEARVAEIRGELKTDGADLDALTAEVDALEARKAELADAANKAAELRKRVAAGEIGTVIESHKEVETMPENRTVTIDSVEYRDAWLKSVARRPLSDVEQRVLTTGLTEDQHVLVPTTVQNSIWDLVFGQHSILSDLQTIRANTVIDIPTHTASSGAANPSEGAAPDEETNTFAKVTLSGKDYAKYVEISYAMERMSLSALMDYLVTEIAKAIGELMAEDAVTNIESAINADNQFTGITYANIAAAFGSLKRATNVAIYATRATIYGSLIGMVDANGNPIFQQPAAGAPLGSIWGAPIKVEDAVGDDALLIGDGSKAVNAVVQDVMIESDKDIKTHNTIISGYARSEVALVDDKGFALVAAATA